MTETEANTPPEERLSREHNTLIGRQDKLIRARIANATTRAVGHHPQAASNRDFINGLGFIEKAYQQEIARARKEGGELDQVKIHSDVVAKFGGAGEAAWQAFDQEINPPGMMSKALDGVGGLFYDKDKGGLQIGGMLGLLAGLWGASKMTAQIAEGGGSSLLAMAAWVIMPLMAGVGGKMLAGAITGAGQSRGGDPIAELARSPQRGASPSPDAQTMGEEPQAAKDEHHVNAEDIGGMTPPPVHKRMPVVISPGQNGPKPSNSGGIGAS